MTQIQITSTNVRKLLEQWHATKSFSHHPFNQLNIVKQHVMPEGITEQTLKTIMSKAVDTLKPNNQTAPHSAAESWHPHLIISKQYLQAESAEAVMRALDLPPHQYYKQRKVAIDRLAAQLRFWERSITLG